MITKNFYQFDMTQLERADLDFLRGYDIEITSIVANVNMQLTVTVLSEPENIQSLIDDWEYPEPAEFYQI